MFPLTLQSTQAVQLAGSPLVLMGDGEEMLLWSPANIEYVMSENCYIESNLVELQF